MKWLRWLLFIPAGLIEMLLMLVCGFLVVLFFITENMFKFSYSSMKKILEIANYLPSMGWYLGGENKNKTWRK